MSLEVKNKEKTYIVWNRDDKEYSFGYPDLTELEVKTIMRIINVSKSPRHIGSSHLLFKTKENFLSYTDMYRKTYINEKVIMSLMDKEVIMKMLNTHAKGSIGVFIYFNSDCEFRINSLTRIVLVEKIVN